MRDIERERLEEDDDRKTNWVVDCHSNYLLAPLVPFYSALETRWRQSVDRVDRLHYSRSMTRVASKFIANINLSRIALFLIREC